jgi:hypothetical protein
VYTEQARVAEMASGADRDNDEHVETQRLTGRDCNSTRYFNSMFFVVTKYMTLYYFSDAIRGWTLI